jgi:hypothetical protein
MGLTKNLYYEIKDIVAEEKQDGVHSYKQKQRTKVFGTNSDHRVRQVLIDILLERVENHKDKILSPIIYEELLGMEIKRSGKVEHSNSTHDDQVFSMLLALYVWYEGVNLMERYGIKKTSIKTDEDVDELYTLPEDTVEIIDTFTEESDLDNDIERSLDAAIKAGGINLKDFIEKRRAEEEAIFNALMHTRQGQKAYRDTYNIPDDVDINLDGNGNVTDLATSVFAGFYSDDDYGPVQEIYNSDGGPMVSTFAMSNYTPGSFDDASYKYEDHFNF